MTAQHRTVGSRVQAFIDDDFLHFGAERFGWQCFRCGAEQHVATFADAERGRDAHECPTPTPDTSTDPNPADAGSEGEQQ